MADRVKLDTEAGCGTLTGSPDVLAIGGHDLFDGVAAAFDVVRVACEAGSTVGLLLPAGTTVQAHCKAPLQQRAGFRIDAAPSLSIAK